MSLTPIAILANRYPADSSTYTVTFQTTYARQKLHILANAMGVSTHALVEQLATQALEIAWNEYEMQGETIEVMENRLLGKYQQNL